MLAYGVVKSEMEATSAAFSTISTQAFRITSGDDLNSTKSKPNLQCKRDGLFDGTWLIGGGGIASPVILSTDAGLGQESGQNVDAHKIFCKLSLNNDVKRLFSAKKFKTSDVRRPGTARKEINASLSSDDKEPLNVGILLA